MKSFFKKLLCIFMTVVLLSGVAVTTPAYTQNAVTALAEENITTHAAVAPDDENNQVNITTTSAEEADTSGDQDDMEDYMDTCPQCSGTGEIEKEKPCTSCDGHGNKYIEVACSYCTNGIVMVTKTYKCTRCWGGSLGIIDPNCYVCGGSGVKRYTHGETCTNCGGKGKLKASATCSKCIKGVVHYYVNCTRCNGTGYISNKCTVTYNANGGTGAPEAQAFKRNTKFKLSTVKPTHEKYEFLGWTTDKIKNDPEYEAGAEFTAQDNITLYAVWDIPYTVTYDANGGTGAPEPQIKKPGISLTLSGDIPKYDGKEFLGWSTDKTATEAEYQPKDGFLNNKNTTLYAVWKTIYSIKIKLKNNASAIKEYQSHGYIQTEVHTVEIENDGSYATGPLSVSLTDTYGQDNSKFVLSTDSIPSIESGASSSFTVRVKGRFPGGTHSTSIKIAGENIAPQYIRFDFTVACLVKVTAGEGGTLRGKYNRKTKEITEEIFPGKNIYLDAEPDDENAVFEGYFVNNRKLYNNSYTVDSDCEIEARFYFSESDVTITSSIGGTVNESGTYTYGRYHDMTLIASPETGYTFDGWYKYNKKTNRWEQIETDTHYRFYVDGKSKEYKIEARFVPIADLSFLDGEIIISATEGAVPNGATFDVIKIAPPPEEAVKKVKEQYGQSSTVLSYYEIRLKATDGTLITELDGEITIRMKLPEGFENGVGLGILQEDTHSKLVEMKSWIENGYICYKTDWLETY